MNQQLTIQFCRAAPPAWLKDEVTRRASMAALGFSHCVFSPPYVWQGEYRMELPGGCELRASIGSGGAIFLRYCLRQAIFTHARVCCPTAEAFWQDVVEPMARYLTAPAAA